MGSHARGIVDQAECAFFLLGVVQPKDGVEPVEKCSDLDDIFGLRLWCIDLVEHTAEELAAKAEVDARRSRRPTAPSSPTTSTP